jgi:hypothetical protein
MTCPDDLSAIKGIGLALALSAAFWLWLFAPVRAQQIDLSKPLTLEQAQNIILELCQSARYASHVYWDDRCETMRNAFAQQKVGEAKPAEKPATESGQ